MTNPNVLPSDNCGDGTHWGCGRPVRFPNVKVLEDARPRHYKYGPHVMFHSECYEKVEADLGVRFKSCFVRKLAQETAAKGTR